MQQKMNKAPTAFVEAANIIADTTSNGTRCNGGPANTTVSSLYDKLKNCATTAVAACNMTLSAADNATVTACANSLTNYTTAFQV
jgi:hypothetical protein